MGLDAQNIQWPSGVGYLAGDRGTEALAVRDVSAGVPETIVATEGFEGVPTGSGTWLLDLVNPHSGLRCLRSAPILNNQDTQYTFTVPPGASSLRLWWRVSSESGFDFFEVYKTSVTPANRLLQQSGTANTWTQSTLFFDGATTIILRYVKDSSSAAGLDLAAVDDLEWIVAAVPAVQLFEPLHLDPANQLKVADAQVDARLAYLNGVAFDMAADLDAINADVDVALSTRASEATLASVAELLGRQVKFARINLALLGDTTVVAAVPGKKIQVLSYMVTTTAANAAVRLQFKSGAVTVLGEVEDIDGAYPVPMAGSILGPLFETAAGEALVLNLSAIKVVKGHLSYVEV